MDAPTHSFPSSNFNPNIPPPTVKCPVSYQFQQVGYSNFGTPYAAYSYNAMQLYPTFSPQMPPPPSQGPSPPISTTYPPGSAAVHPGSVPAPRNYAATDSPIYSTLPPPNYYNNYSYPPPVPYYAAPQPPLNYMYPPPMPSTPPTPPPPRITPPPSPRSVPNLCPPNSQICGSEYLVDCNDSWEKLGRKKTNQKVGMTPPVSTTSPAQNPSLIQIELTKSLSLQKNSTSRNNSFDKYAPEERSLPNLKYRSKRKDRGAPSMLTASSQQQSSRPQAKLGRSPMAGESERDRLLKTWRSQYCETTEEINRKLAEMANNEEKEVWIRSSPAELYYARTKNGGEVESTSRLDALCQLFEDELVKRAKRIESTQEPYNPVPKTRKKRLCRHKSEKCSSSESSDDDFEPEEDCSMEELSKKIQHPYRLHPDLWHNEPGEMNDGPLCRCSAKSRRTGIRHGIYPNEKGFSRCTQNSNNAGRLYHYRITISPPTNFLTKTPTIIKYDQHEFLFEGFSLFSHAPIKELPTCKVIRFNIEYTILYIEEKIPENFTIRELDLFFNYLFFELLELVDFTIIPHNAEGDVCPCFHFLPRFVRDLEDNGKEVLSMCEVLKYLLDSSGPLVDRATLDRMMEMSQHEWQDYVDMIKGMVVTNPGRKPCSIRVDQLDRNVSDLPECIDSVDVGIIHPVIVHFGMRPPQLSYAGNPEYQKAWKEYVKFRHLVANMSKPSYEDKRKLEAKEGKLQEMRTQGRMKRNVTVAISSKGFFRTGVMCDIVQHAMLIPVLTGHLRFHQTLDLLEETIEYKFQNRYLLQLALTHPSYKENFGTNPDHARNSLTNCGIRQPEYGDRKIHYMNTRKRGINTLINIMSRFGKEYDTDSNITHNERLEFLGDAVVEFLSSIHLFFIFPDLEEGGLATYRAAIVQNQHLAVLAKKLHLDEFMLYAHGSDLCHELELRHAMANCFEALMGALLLDGGITGADNVFALALFADNPKLKDVWVNYPPHPLQEQEPLGDRQWIESYQLLKNLTNFEEAIGVEYKHIRLLARAFTDRSIGFTHLTLGSNQRLEFLGDTVLQLISSEFLYRHFPEHHEGHLSLLRSSLVNNRTQAVVCDDLGMTQYAVYANPKAELKTKDRADLLEAFLGSLYVDKGLDHCETFCQVCLFPRLQIFIMNQDWNDPKSKLQQCCLTLRTMDGGEPDIPWYKVIECKGPTNTRIYTVAVYFRGKRLASATGHSIQQAEMNAAKQALDNSRDLFPQLDHQKRVIAKNIKRQKPKDTASESKYDSDSSSNNTFSAANKKKFSSDFDESNLPKQYRMREDISSDELPPDSDEEKKVRKKKKHKKHKKKRQSSPATRKSERKSPKSEETEKSEKNEKTEEPEKSDENEKSTSTAMMNPLSPLSEEEVEFLDEMANILDEGFSDQSDFGNGANDRKNNSNSAGKKSLKSKIYEKEIACFKIEGAEELSSDVESGEIL